MKKDLKAVGKPFQDMLIAAGFCLTCFFLTIVDNALGQGKFASLGISGKCLGALICLTITYLLICVYEWQFFKAASDPFPKFLLVPFGISTLGTTAVLLAGSISRVTFLLRHTQCLTLLVCLLTTFAYAVYVFWLANTVPAYRRMEDPVTAEEPVPVTANS